MGKFGCNYIALTIIFLVLPPCFFASASTRTEAEALLQWKSSLLMSSSFNSWSLSNLRSLCNWRGIVCNGDGAAVSEINLPYARLSGTLHHLDFTSFPSLTGFDISGNYFNGSIPPAIGDLPDLVFLDLSYNRFDGSIPPQIGKLRELQYLNFSCNNFSGVFPHQIGNLQKSAETRGPPVRGGVTIEQRGSPGRGGVAVHQKPEGRGGVGRSGEAEAVGRSRSASAASAYRGLSAEAVSALWTRGGGGCGGGGASCKQLAASRGGRRNQG
ncbi:probable leucine-rich repeat receptor-like protein kinase At1g35710 [Ipomoea triloba]|uniref:probable leucine-rich repeat receptor-like protein kinase At1g35710 n=1 Tax=Ipomoea triloba TaxID=35885 RepID=UPI00125E5127|nr:probable leucine-rich repeat receptor-like protein kinase At1g35710 [Ipomoea triloba]